MREARRRHDDSFMLVPLVLDDKTLDERTRQWVYVDATTGLTDGVGTIYLTKRRAIHTYLS